MGSHVLIRCHCGQLSEEVQLSQSVPVESFLCHCNSCRHITGALTLAGLRLASPPVDAFTTKLAKYASSDKLWRYFCETCGTHVCYYVTAEDRWSVCSGAVEQVVGEDQGSLETITKHEFVGDTEDGGLLLIFPPSTVYLEAKEGEPAQDWRLDVARRREKAVTDQSAAVLGGACHCGQVRFSVNRPNESDPRSKWKAGVCACRSCRLSCGQPLIPWAFNIPLAKIQWLDGGAHDGSIHPSLRRFKSSDHASRDFCKTCGASVFFYSSRKPGEADINVGVLRAAEGALARSWFTWDTESIHYPEDAVDVELIKILQGNLLSLKE